MRDTIDELPAGMPRQTPTLDMTRIVGQEDILMLCFDTLRYDAATLEEAAGGTPTLNRYGPWEKRHAPGNFTYPSHFAIFAGFFPSPVEPHALADRQWLFFPLRVGSGNIAPPGSFPFRRATFVEALADAGYATWCVGGVNFFSKKNEMGSVFPGYFQKSDWRPAFGCTSKESAARQVDFVLERLERQSPDQRLFLYINFSAIHYPNHHYLPGKKTDDLDTHRAALRYVDQQLPRLFAAFRERGNPLVIAFSDHGTCYGEEGYRYHCVSHEKVLVVPYKHFRLDAA
jgi:arylsulfatase A-like enzyme